MRHILLALVFLLTAAVSAPAAEKRNYTLGRISPRGSP